MNGGLDHRKLLIMRAYTHTHIYIYIDRDDARILVPITESDVFEYCAGFPGSGVKDFHVSGCV